MNVIWMNKMEFLGMKNEKKNDFLKVSLYRSFLIFFVFKCFELKNFWFYYNMKI